MKIIDHWLIVLGIINLILFTTGLILFIPKRVFKIRLGFLFQNIKNHLPFLIIILGVVSFHLLEINLLDPFITKLIGIDFANNIQNFEGDIVLWFYQHWTPGLTWFFVIMYIAVYPFTLWFSPLYFILSDEKKSMKTLAYGLLLIYIIAFPFYLLIPVTNVYKFYGLQSALESVVPTVENFFYFTTTQNNCFPSLHVAMTILVAWSVYLTGNKKFSYFTFFCMISVILSVIYLAIHWITDVVSGALLAVVVILLLNYLLRENQINGTKS